MRSISSLLAFGAFAAFALAALPAARAADFNGDHFADLAIVSRGPGAPETDDRGRVTIMFGSGSGLTGLGFLVLEPTAFGIDDVTADFGAALAAGDFDDDGFDDLAIGVPGATIAGHESAGCVIVIRGGASGLDVAHPTTWTQDSTGVANQCEDPASEDGHHLSPERFGFSLASADFDDDGFDDLVIGVSESTANHVDVGAIHVLRGSSLGLTAKKDRFITQNTTGVKNACESFDEFGATLATGDLNGDGFADLVVDSLGELVGDNSQFGAISLFFGSSSGLSTKKNRFYGAGKLGQPSEGITLSLGGALDLADWNDDGFDDLAIGAPGQAADTGAFLAVLGAAQKKLDLSSLVDMDETEIAGLTAAEIDQFGVALASGDFNGDGHVDLAVSAPGATVAGQSHAGLVIVVGGGPTGLDGPVLPISEGAVGVPGTLVAFHNIGRALATGDFNGDGFADLVIGVPNEPVDVVFPTPDTLFGAGAVIVLYGAPLGLTHGTGALFVENSGAQSAGFFGRTLLR